MRSELVSRLWTVAVRLSAEAKRAQRDGQPDWPALAAEADAAASLAADAMSDPTRAPEGFYRPQSVRYQEC